MQKDTANGTVKLASHARDDVAFPKKLVMPPHDSIASGYQLSDQSSSQHMCCVLPCAVLRLMYTSSCTRALG